MYSFHFEGYMDGVYLFKLEGCLRTQTLVPIKLFTFATYRCSFSHFFRDAALVGAGCRQHATTTTTTTDQMGPAQHNAAIGATCVRAHHFPYKPIPHTSCTY